MVASTCTGFIKANLLKIWKVYNYADRFLDFSMLYLFPIVISELYSNLYVQLKVTT